MLLFRHGGVNPDGPGETEVAVCIALRERSSSRALFARAHARWHSRRSWHLYRRLPCCAMKLSLASCAERRYDARSCALIETAHDEARARARARARLDGNFSARTYCVPRVSFPRSRSVPPPFIIPVWRASERERMRGWKKDRARGQARPSVFDAPIGSVLPL
jgi:hypothetical protein